MPMTMHLSEERNQSRKEGARKNDHVIAGYLGVRSRQSYRELGPRMIISLSTIAEKIKQQNRIQFTMAAVLAAASDTKSISDQILNSQPAQKYTFSFTPFLLETYRHGISPNRPICKAYLQGHCPQGTSCPDRHVAANSNSNFNNLVCKHWLRGLCKKGEHCEFLHEFNLRKMPECNFFTRNGYCSNGGMHHVDFSISENNIC